MADPTLTICGGLKCIWTITTDYGQLFSPTFLGQNRPGTGDNSYMRGLSADADTLPQGRGYVWFECAAECRANSSSLSQSRHVFVSYGTFVDSAVTPPPGQWQLQLESVQTPSCSSPKCNPNADDVNRCPSVPTWNYYETEMCTASYDSTADNPSRTTYYPFIEFYMQQLYCGLDGRTQWLTLYSGPDNKSPVLAK